MQPFLLLMTTLITCDLPIWIDASMQTHRNNIWSLSVMAWILQFISRLTLSTLSITLWWTNFMAIKTTLKELSICSYIDFIINASSPSMEVIHILLTVVMEMVEETNPYPLMEVIHILLTVVMEMVEETIHIHYWQQFLLRWKQHEPRCKNPTNQPSSLHFFRITG